jgi:hypothetical protein
MQQNKYQTQRDEAARIAEEKREKARRSYEERMQAQKMEFEKGLRAEDRNYRMKENKQQQSFQLERDAAQAAREANDPYRMSLVEESRARVEAMRSPASSSGGSLAKPQGANQKDIDAARRMVETLMRQEKLSAAQAEERVAQMFSEDIAQRAFPGRAERMGQNAQTLQKGLGAARRFLPDSFFQQ